MATTQEISGFLAVLPTPVGTTAVTTEETLWSVNLPANTLSSPGEAIRLRALLKRKDDSNSSRIRFYFGTTVLEDTTMVVNGNFTLDRLVSVVRLTQTTQRGMSVGFHGNGTSEATSILPSGPTQDLASAVEVKITAQNNVANVDGTVLLSASIELVSPNTTSWKTEGDTLSGDAADTRLRVAAGSSPPANNLVVGQQTANGEVPDNTNYSASFRRHGTSTYPGTYSSGVSLLELSDMAGDGPSAGPDSQGILFVTMPRLADGDSYAANASLARFRNDTGTAVVVTGNRNVGIATGTPASRLDVADGAITLSEMAAPAAPAANRCVIYAEDNGSGKTRLMVRFPSGAAQQIAIEP